ncbi:hypothetical protein EGW08_008192 [Elysia chlorotica]|uniref:UspA domain-containing protein n=1 Tax=Elysia chlorotica TaxID=188477 RepID=A0A3S1BHX8_ELYCH|nr:hypothetical protein EGW08_008192 [Elysia chlorotica]
MAASETVRVARRVLIGMDGSLNANDAFSWYMKHVHQENDFIIIAYCPDISVGLLTSFERMVQTNMPLLTHDDLAGERERVDEVQRLLEQKLTQHQLTGCVQRLTSSNAGHALVKEAEREKVSMIVIGCRGHGTLRRTVLGSVSTYILHHSHVPVLIYPHHHHHHHHHKQQQHQPEGEKHA